MAERTYSWLLIAESQLHRALRLWEGSVDYLSVITLAGAAEEVLGGMVRAAGKSNAMDEIGSTVPRFHRLLAGEELSIKEALFDANFARNRLKHLDDGQPIGPTIDAREEAREMLSRAIDNYWTLQQDLSEPMSRFEELQRRSRSRPDWPNSQTGP